MQNQKELSSAAQSPIQNNDSRGVSSILDWLDSASDAVASAGNSVMESLTDLTRPALVAFGLEYPEVVQDAVRNQDSPLRADSQSIIGRSFDSKDSMVEAASAELPSVNKPSEEVVGKTEQALSLNEDIKSASESAAKATVTKLSPSFAPPARRSPGAGRHDSSVRSPSPRPAVGYVRHAVAMPQCIRDNVHPTRGQI